MHELELEVANLKQTEEEVTILRSRVLELEEQIEVVKGDVLLIPESSTLNLS